MTVDKTVANIDFRELSTPRIAGDEPLFDYCMQLKGKIFRDINNRCTLRFERHGKAYFIKQHFGIGWKEFFKNIVKLRLPIVSAKTEWQAIQFLNKIDILTIELVAYGERYFNPAHRQSFIVSKELQHCVSLEDLCQDMASLALELRIRLPREIAQVTRRLHHHGVNHRDCYLCHLWLNPETFELYIMDLHRAQIRKTVPRRWLIKDIGALYFSALDANLSRKDVFRFLRAYFDLPLRAILSRHKSFLLAVQNRAIKLYQKLHHRIPEQAVILRDQCLDV
ncbi:MAG: lipopolysaccharide core heptose(I) kinase RfaP [Pseudomonadota bacterium]